MLQKYREHHDRERETADPPDYPLAVEKKEDLL
jgi:hypothetical protein